MFRRLNNTCLKSEWVCQSKIPYYTPCYQQDSHTQASFKLLNNDILYMISLMINCSIYRGVIYAVYMLQRKEIKTLLHVLKGLIIWRDTRELESQAQHFP